MLCVPQSPGTAYAGFMVMGALAAVHTRTIIIRMRPRTDFQYIFGT